MRHIHTAFALLGLLAFAGGPSLAADRLVVFQAESGALGSDYLTATDAGAGVTYITAGTDLNSGAGNQAPAVAEKVATYTVTFPQAGTYTLYARLRIGPGGGADDSFYYGNSFGAKSPTDGAVWILVNNIAGVGYTAPGDSVLGGGTAAGGVWKWLRLSQSNFGEPGPQFVVPADALTQTIQIGTRENGLDFDQFAFGLTGNTFTVANLLNTAPAVTAGQSFTAYEQAINGDVVGTVVATDVDPGTTFQAWTITGGTGAGVFAINAATGVITVADAAAIDPASTPSYTLNVTVSDGIYASAEQTVTIDVSTLDSLAIISQPANGVYKAGDVLAFIVALDRPMTVGGGPRLVLDVGGATRYAGYVSGSGTNRLTFSTAITVGDDDADGIALISPIDLNGGSITDGAANPVALGFTPPNTSGVRVDSTAPAAPVITAYTDATRTLTGTAEPASTVSVYLDAGLAGTSVVNALGNWTFVINASQFPAGANPVTVTASATDPYGNVGAASPGFAVVIMVDPNAPVIVQAESGVRGSDFNQLTAAGVTYIAPATNYLGDDGVIGGAGASRPNTANKVATYTVTFPQGGTYDLYVRVRVNNGGANDDSFYYGNGFGTKDPSNPDHWIIVNGLSGFGFTAAGEWVTAQGSLWGGGGAANNVFKWLKLSGANLGEAPVQFVVPAGERTQTFQIGSREDGLDIDQFAFALDGLFFTVANLNGAQAGTTVSPPPPYDPTHPPLATGKPKWLGSAWSTAQSPNFDNYFNQVTPENAGKWGSVEGARDTFNWTELDTTYNLAKSNGWPFRFHILVWGAQQPAWIESISTADQLEEIKEWFAAVAARYPDIDYLEVVNEPLHDPPLGASNGNYLNALLAYDTTETGEWAWVINAFKLARSYFPNTPLVLNDYGVENDGNMMPRYIGIVQQLQQRDLIDIVGVQGHAFNVNANTATLTANINNLANATGLPIQVTELDIDGLDENFQASEYQRVVPFFWEHPSVMGVTLWGYRPGHWRTAQGAPIVRANGSEEPSMIWLKSYIEGANPNLRPVVERWPRAQTKFVQEDAVFTARVRGNPAPTLQWQWSADEGATWVDIVDDGVTFSGANTETLVISDLSAEFDGMLVRILAQNAFGTDDGRPARLTVDKFTTEPALVDLELTQTFDGTAKVLTVITDPPGLPVIVTYNGSTTPPTNAGTYLVVATVDSPLYQGSVTGTLVIEPASGAIAFGDLVQPYDGTPRVVSATTSPAGGNVVLTYDGSPEAPVYPGTYAVAAEIVDPNFVPGTTAAAVLRVTITGLVRHAPVLDGDVDGSVQVLLPESVTLNSSAMISGDLLMPGTPRVRLNGRPTYGGTIDADGDAAPTYHQVTLNNRSVLRHVVRRVDAISLPEAVVPASPTGTRNVVLFRAGQSAGSFATLRSLTLLLSAGDVAVPPGSYDSFLASGRSGFILGQPGATTPAVYNFQWLTLNNGARLRIVGPVIVNVANLVTLNDATGGSATDPEWLLLNVRNGGVLLNGSSRLNGFVVTPSGAVVVNNGAVLFGGVIADRFVLNNNGQLLQAEQ